MASLKAPYRTDNTEQLISNAWDFNTAHTTMAMTSTEMSQDSYILDDLCS